MMRAQSYWGQQQGPFFFAALGIDDVRRGQMQPVFCLLPKSQHLGVEYKQVKMNPIRVMPKW